MKKYANVALLSIGQGLSSTVISLLTLTSVLVGKQLAPNAFLVTLPITMTILGSTVMVHYASLLMGRYRRKKAFLFSAVIGFFGTMIGILAVYKGSFIAFSIATFMLGCATVFNQYYRFAAAEISKDKRWQKRSTSLVISGGVIGGILGPYLASKGVTVIPDMTFLGNFIFMLIIFMALFVSQYFLSLEKPMQINKAMRENIERGEKYPAQFIWGTLSCAIGFALMTLIMNAAPLSMHNESYLISHSAFALQLHFVAMYLPALFSPFILKKISTKYFILCGIYSFLIGAIASLCFQAYMGYVVVLIFSGLGWALMFTGGTFYLNKLQGKEKYRLQGISSMITYLTNLVMSFSVGIFFLAENGWVLINTLVILIALGYLIFYKKIDT